jgi:hypothetical protein
MKKNCIYIPSEGPSSWKPLCAEPEKHWKKGYSAYSTAHSWEEANGLPKEIALLFKNADKECLRDASLALAIPEHKVRLAGKGYASQNDIFALLSCKGGLVSVMVEGKAEEDFDKTLGAWKKTTSTKGVEVRLTDVARQIGLSVDIPDAIRYQLLHRMASAVIEAKRFHAPFAVMIIQSFASDDTVNHYDDFEAFIKLYGKRAKKGQLIELTSCEGRRLFASWVQSKPT